MTTNDNGVIDQNNKKGEVDLEIEVTLDDTTEDVELLKKNLATAIAQKDHWKNKATATKPEDKKEEKKEVKEEKPVEKKPDESGALSTTDMYALIKAGVEEEDIKEVTDYAKLKGITVSEALKSSVIKTILSEKQEERKTAEATNTSKAKVSTGKISDDTLLRKAQEGVMPESDEDMLRLIKLRKGIK